MENSIVLSPLGHTWIFDIDGTVCKHNGYKIDGHDTILPGVKDFFNQIPEGDFIIFLTSREECYREITESFLKDNGIRYNKLIFGAPYGERIIVNDNKPSGLNMSRAICLKRDGGIKEEIIIDTSL